jgi:hypothetical protein
VNLGRLHGGWLVPATVAAAGLGFWSGQRLLFPLVCMAPAYPVMVARLLAGQRRRAVAAMLIWAATLAPVSVALCLWAPEHARETVLRGEPYTQEMFHWIRTGDGAESRPARFLVEHAVHLAIFVVLSLATASLASIYFGTVLLNYMAYYVAAVLQATGGAPLAAAMAWHPWSMVRIAAFILIGVVLAEPLLARIRPGRVLVAGRGRWLLVALGGLLVDAAMKTALAPYWRLWLGRMID